MSRADEYKSRLFTLLESSPDAIMINDLAGTVVECSAAALRLLGYDSKEELLGKSVFELVPEDMRTLAAGRMQDLLSSEVIRNREYLALKKDGATVEVELSAALVRDAGGNPTAVVSITKDITERRQRERELAEAQEALRQSEIKYRALFSNAPVGIFIMSLDGESLTFNESFARMHGYVSPKEMEHLKLSDLDAPETSKYAPERLRRLIKGEALSFEVEHYKKDGQLFPLSVTCNVVNIDGVPHFLGFHQDITEIKKAEESLRESEERLRLIYKNIDEGVILYDVELNYIFWNPYMERLTGLCEKDVRGKNALELFPHLREHGAGILMKRALAGEITVAPNMIYHMPGSGKVIRTTGRYQPHINSAGEIIGVLGIVRDTTDLWLVEKQLKESEEQFRLAFEQSKDAIFWADVETELFVNCNRSAELLVGMTRDEIIGQHQKMLHPPGLAEKYESEFKEHMKSPISRTEEAQLITKYGKTVPVEISSTVVEIAGKTIIQGIFRDVSERNRANAEKDALLQQLHQSQKMEAIGQLAGGIAHDFNNILAVIIGTADLMMKDLPEAGQSRKHMERISRVAKRAKDLTLNLLTFARKEKLDIRAIRTEELIDELIDLLKRSLSKKVRISKECCAGRTTVSVDVNQVIQALLNVCINAADAMPEGGTLTIVCDDVEMSGEECGKLQGIGPGQYAKITITDTGTGMSKEVRDRIFDPFFTTKERGKGTGLGLPITHGIIQSHGGAITVDSEHGRGTSMEILLPVSERVADVQSAPGGEIQEAAAEGTVFIIDDDRDFLDMTAEILQAEGFNVIPALGPTKAIELFRKHEDAVDLVILDMMMPELGGEEVFRVLRKMNPDVKVLVCSGYSRDGKAGQILAEGANGFLQKPFDSVQLLNVVASMLK